MSQLTGILKQMSDSFAAKLEEEANEENDRIKSYDQLMAAKAKEVAALTKSIEEKSVRLGELQVNIVELKEDLDDTQKQLQDDRKFLADLGKTCATKAQEHQENMKMRS